MDPADPHDQRHAAEEPVLETKRFAISGLHSETEARKLEETLRQTQGVSEVKADHGEGVVAVTFDARKVNAPAMHDAVQRAGYHPAPRPDEGF